MWRNWSERKPLASVGRVGKSLRTTHRFEHHQGDGGGIEATNFHYARLKKRIVAIPDEKVAAAEANRCLNCGVCADVLERELQTACVNACPSHCIYYRDVWGITPKSGPYIIA
jgi:ferredoxin